MGEKERQENPPKSQTSQAIELADVWPSVFLQDEA